MERITLRTTLLYCLLFCFFTVAGCEISTMRLTIFHAKYERTVELSQSMSGVTLFSGRSNDGWITVTGDDVTECSVTATIIAGADSDERAREIAEEAEVRLEKFGSKLSVKLIKPVIRNYESVDVQFTAIVPRNCNMEAITDDGDITIENINGNIEVKTDDGKTNISQINGNVRVRNGDGSITVKDVNIKGGLSRADEWIDIQTDDGAVILSRLVGDVKVRSDDGSVRVEDVIGNVNIQTNDGRITVIYNEEADGVFDISMVTDDGAIDFTAPKIFSANVEVIIDDGSIYTALPVQVIGKLGRNGIKGIIGTGEGRLYIKTDDGSVRIR